MGIIDCTCGKIWSLNCLLLIKQFATYVRNVYTFVSFGFLIVIVLCRSLLHMSACCLTSRPIIDGDEPSFRSNENVAGLLLISRNFDSDVYAFHYDIPFPHYEQKNSDKLSCIPIRIQNAATLIITRVEVGGPPCTTRLGQDRLLTPLKKKKLYWFQFSLW